MDPRTIVDAGRYRLHVFTDPGSFSTRSRNRRRRWFNHREAHRAATNAIRRVSASVGRGDRVVGIYAGTVAALLADLSNTLDKPLGQLSIGPGSMHVGRSARGMFMGC